MPRLSRKDRAFVLAVLAEGNSVMSTARITGVDKDAILRLLVDIAPICRSAHNGLVRNLKCERIEADELWSFIKKKQKRCSQDDLDKGFGDSWLWLATDIRTKLIVSYLVADRGAESADVFMTDLKSRLTHRVQLATDGLLVYAEAVNNNFKKDEVVFAQRGMPVIGAEEASAVTSRVERLNLTVRMSDRRFTRKTNAFSKKYANHAASVDFHVAFYNFIRPHMSLDGCTPAMEAAIADRAWSFEDLIERLEAKEREADDAALLKFRSLRKLV